jgi:hypothetical protein
VINIDKLGNNLHTIMLTINILKEEFLHKYLFNIIIKKIFVLLVELIYTYLTNHAINLANTLNI